MEGDCLVEGTNLEVTAVGLRRRRGLADEKQEQVSAADKRGIESVITATTAGQTSAAPGAAAASALLAEPQKGTPSILHRQICPNALALCNPMPACSKVLLEEPSI